MQTEYEQVREFMRAFGQAVPDEVTMPDIGVQNMRDDLIAEECHELFLADTVEQKFDAVLDLLYVVFGAGVDCGFTPEQIEAGFKEVHRSNMSKMWTEDETIHVPYDCSAVFMGSHLGDRCYRVRRSDGKIVKSPSYSPPNLKEILEGKL